MFSSPYACVELFHLMFLDVLARKIDSTCYALKGGGNLRFFMKSCRYSEDLDIDVGTISRERLEDTVSAIIEGSVLGQLLDLRGLRIENWSAPKQTETTQRWKCALAVAGRDIPYPTKVEFSRRGMGEGLTYGPVDPGLIRFYQLTPFMVSHYGPAAASQQKAQALATRRVIQARDVFDLHLLLASGCALDATDEGVAATLGRAAENALSVSYGVFRAQVLSYLHPDYRAQYDSREAWDDIVLAVVRALEGAAG